MDNENPRTPNAEAQTSRRLKVAKWVMAGALGFAGFASIGHPNPNAPSHQGNPNHPTNPSHDPHQIIIDDTNMRPTSPNPDDPNKIVVDDSHMGDTTPKP